MPLALPGIGDYFGVQGRSPRPGGVGGGGPPLTAGRGGA
jgi:hypothetical protein